MSVSYEHFSASSNSETSNFKMVRTKMLNLRLHILMSGFKVVISSFYLHTMVGFILTPLAADLMVWLSINIIKFALSFSYLRSIRYLRWIVTKAEEVYLLDRNIAHKCLWFRRLYSLQVFLWFKRKKNPLSGTTDWILTKPKKQCRSSDEDCAFASVCLYFRW